MTALTGLIARNVKLYFKDKGLFFTSLITPMILLILFATFLAKTYKDSYQSMLSPLKAAGIEISEEWINGLAAAQIFSSLLAVSCVTVAFCSSILMVQDRVTGARTDLTVAPIRKSQLALSYYASTFFSTVLVCFGAIVLCLLYAHAEGWFYDGADILRILFNTLLLILFGTAFSCAVCVFLTSQGQITASGTIVSAGYGFLCGAYMPISQFGEGLRNALSVTPGICGTSLLRQSTMDPVFREIKSHSVPDEVVTSLRDALDCRLFVSGDALSESSMYGILLASTAVLLLIYILVIRLQKKK